MIRRIVSSSHWLHLDNNAQLLACFLVVETRQRFNRIGSRFFTSVFERQTPRLIMNEWTMRCQTKREKKNNKRTTQLSSICVYLGP